MTTILVTGIGGIVGQGILRNIHAMGLDAYIVGTNTAGVSAGNHLCDQVYQVPYANEDNYIDSMREIVDRHRVSLIVPSTDYEAYYLAASAGDVQSIIAASPSDICRMCLDKFLNYQAFSNEGIEFARSFLPSSYDGEFSEYIVKPREGRGSRSIYVNPKQPNEFTDDFVIQEFLDGPELTTTFYVRQTGELHGFITLMRDLENGSTASCEVVFEYDEQISAMLQSIVAKFPFRGSSNIQSRVTDRGVVPFEINCRISGTNSIRSQFGFPDVAYTIQELLLKRHPDAPAVVKGSAMRVTHDVIYPNITLAEVKSRHDEFYLY
jgi:carbamoyl-phosphate synthase large subunit